MGVPQSRVLVVSSLAWSLVNFRGRLLAEMVREGHEVIAAAPDEDEEVIAALAAMGVRFAHIPMQRTARNMLADAGTLSALVGLMRRCRPDHVLAYTQKPIVYGGIAARIAGVPHFHAMVSGLGFAFTGDDSPALRAIVARLYRIALGRADSVFLFNSDDEADMRRHGMLPPGPSVVQVPGSGIDTDAFAATPLPPGPPRFLLVARLLVNKGIRDYVAAARIVKAACPEAKFQLLGPTDPNPAGLPESEVAAWQREGVIEYLGHTRDVAPYLREASVFVLPTWYREGLPRTILEAMASARPVIATDSPGCRDAVVDGETGFLVPVRDPDSLAAAMLRLARDPALAQRMGRAGRTRAEEVYAVERVNHLLLTTMGLRRGPLAGVARALEAA